ncbi:MAG: alpha/beta hydrolase [Rickettsiales bacterium]|jgi:alpha/beta superfamily hydrolase|nr:alpha/beta hydrolase [Rickettsiales bacterium]
MDPGLRRGDGAIGGAYMIDIIIQGTAGKIHGVYSKGFLPSSPMAVIVPGAPEKGHHMNDRITYAMFRAFADIGFATLRFNYRGIGMSIGSRAGLEGDIMDTASVLDWIQNQNEEGGQIWIAGYDTGVWTTLQTLMRRPEIDGFAIVSPDIDTQDLSFLSSRPNKGMLIQGLSEPYSALEFGTHLAKVLKSKGNIDTESVRIKGNDAQYLTGLKLLYDNIKGYAKKETSEGTLL